MSKAKLFLKADKFEYSRSVESNLISTRQLFSIRAIFSLFNLIVLILMIVQNHNIPISFGMFLTNFGFYGLTIYIWWSTYLGFRYLRNPEGYVPFREHHWFLHFLYQLFYETVIIYAFIISVIYWSILAKAELPKLPPLALFLTIARHLFNFIIMASEFFLGRNLIYLTHFPIIALFGILYICLAIVVHAIYDVWAYPFLDYEKSPLTFGLTIAGIFIFAILYYLASFYIHNLRDRLFKQRYEKVNSIKVEA